MERCYLKHGRGQPLGPVGIQNLSPGGTEDTPGNMDIGLQNFVWYPPANHPGPSFRSQVSSTKPLDASVYRLPHVYRPKISRKGLMMISLMRKLLKKSAPRMQKHSYTNCRSLQECSFRRLRALPLAPLTSTFSVRPGHFQIVKYIRMDLNPTRWERVMRKIVPFFLTSMALAATPGS
jgi:hypothetical protein